MEKHIPARRPFRPGGVRRPAGFILFITVLLIAGLHMSGAAPGAGATAAEELATLLRCDPADISGVVGQPLDFDIYVEDVVDLWGGDVRMSFDPAIVQIVDADPNAEGIQILLLDDFLTANFVLRKNGDNEAGAIWYAVTHLNGPWEHEPADGSGALARVTLEPLQAGSFEMAFTYHLLNDRDGFEIETTAVECQVTISDAPDPDTLTYMPLVFPGIKEPPPFRD